VLSSSPRDGGVASYSVVLGGGRARRRVFVTRGFASLKSRADGGRRAAGAALTHQKTGPHQNALFGCDVADGCLWEPAPAVVCHIACCKATNSRGARKHEFSGILCLSRSDEPARALHLRSCGKLCRSILRERPLDVFAQKMRPARRPCTNPPRGARRPQLNTRKTHRETELPGSAFAPPREDAKGAPRRSKVDR
jgi:hypothetical protein